jgi:hypothetical protein
MKLTEEFRQNADEWRQIGKIAATDEHRRRISEIANTWLAWAERRERMLRAENLQSPEVKRADLHDGSRFDRASRHGNP